MVENYALLNLPTAAELPQSDDTPVDNELQDFIPHLLKQVLASIWGDRHDWFFGVDMGIYYNTQNPRVPIVPDGFLCLGVERVKGNKLRGNYVLWEEKGIAPILVIEHVSPTYGQEYDQKLQKYMQLGVLYYVIYNPEHWQRDKHEPFEVYKLQDGTYIKQQGEPLWMPEIGLGIGRSEGLYCGVEREWVYWFDQEGNKFITLEEIAAREKATNLKLRSKLRELGIDPDSL